MQNDIRIGFGWGLASGWGAFDGTGYGCIGSGAGFDDGTGNCFVNTENNEFKQLKRISRLITEVRKASQ